MNAFERNVKRIGDCFLALGALIVFSPLFLICYIAVKSEDGGPAIFKQERIVGSAVLFNIYKFRSMKLDAEKYGPALYAGAKDPRMTKSAGFFATIIWTNFPSFGMYSVVIWPLSDPVPNVSSL